MALLSECENLTFMWVTSAIFHTLAYSPLNKQSSKQEKKTLGVEVLAVVTEESLLGCDAAKSVEVASCLLIGCYLLS